MTMWHSPLIYPNMRAEYDKKQFLKQPQALLGTGAAFWGPPAKDLKSKLPDDFRLNLVDLGVSQPDAHAFATPNTIWVVDNSADRGIWALNVSDDYARSQAEKEGHKLFAGWYMRVGSVPFAETLWSSEIKKLGAEDNWAMYNKMIGRSLDEIRAENVERQKKADNEIEAARQEKELKDKEQLAKDIKAGKVPATTTGTGTTGTGSTPVPGTWLVPDTTYELVALQGSSPVPVDQAWRQPKSYRWRLTDDPNEGFRLGGRPGAGPYVAGGQTPSSFGLPAFVVGRASNGQAGVIAGQALSTLFGPDWAKP